MIDSRYIKWTHASILKHFVASPHFDLLENNPTLPVLPLVMEGLGVGTEYENRYVDLRINGPSLTKRSKNNYILEALVSVLVTGTSDTNNQYDFFDDIGKVVELLDSGFMGFKDDGSEWGCFTFAGSNDVPDKIRVLHFGNFDKDSNLRRSAIEATFTKELT